MDVVYKNFMAGPVIGMDTAIVVDPDDSKIKMVHGMNAFKEVSDLNQTCDNDPKKLLKLLCKLISTSKGYKALCMDDNNSLCAESKISPIMLYVMSGGFVPSPSSSYSDVNRLKLKTNIEVGQCVSLPALNLFHLLLRGYFLRPNEDCIKDVFLPKKGPISGCIQLICGDIGGAKGDTIVKRNKYVTTYNYFVTVTIVVRLAACLVSHLNVDCSSESEDSPAGKEEEVINFNKDNNMIVFPSSVDVPSEGSLNIDVSNIYRDGMDANGVSVALATLNSQIVKKSTAKFNRFIVVFAEASALTYMLKYAASAVDIIYVGLDPLNITNDQLLSCLKTTRATTIFLDRLGANMMNSIISGGANIDLRMCLFDHEGVLSEFNAKLPGHFSQTSVLLENILPSNTLTACLNILKWRCAQESASHTINGDVVKVVSVPFEYDMASNEYIHSLSYISSIAGFTQLAIPITNNKTHAKHTTSTALIYSKSYCAAQNNKTKPLVTGQGRSNMGMTSADTIVLSKIYGNDTDCGVFVSYSIIGLGGSVAILPLSRLFSLQGLDINQETGRHNSPELEIDNIFIHEKTHGQVCMSILREIYTKIKATVLVMNSEEITLLVSWILCMSKDSVSMKEGIKRSVRYHGDKRRRRDSLNFKNLFYKKVVDSMMVYGCRDLFEKIRLTILSHPLNMIPTLHSTSFDIYTYLTSSTLVTCAYHPSLGICMATPDFKSKIETYTHGLDNTNTKEVNIELEANLLPKQWTLQSVLDSGYYINPSMKGSYGQHDIIDIHREPRTVTEKEHLDEIGDTAVWNALRSLTIQSRVGTKATSCTDVALVHYNEGIYGRIWPGICIDNNKRKSLYDEVLRDFVKTHCIIPAFIIKTISVEQLPGVDIQSGIQVEMSLHTETSKESQIYLSELRARSLIGHTALILPFSDESERQYLEADYSILAEDCKEHLNEVLVRFGMTHLVVVKFDIIKC